MTSSWPSTNPWNQASETKANISQNKEITNNKEFESIYGKSPSQTYVLKKLQSSDIFKGKTYDEALTILKTENEPLYKRLQKNVLSAEEIKERSKNVDFEKIYGKNLVEASVLKKLKELKPEVYNKCTTYEEAMQILKDRRPSAYEYIKNNVSPRHPLQDANEETIDKELQERWYGPEDIAKQEQAKTEEIAKKKEELFKPEAKPAEKKPEPPKKTAGRWTEADEASRPGSKPTPKKETNKEEKIKKTWGWFFKKIFRPLRHPIRTARLLGRAAVTPIGLTTYKLADIWEKEKTGAKDRFNWFKKIAKGEKKKK